MLIINIKVLFSRNGVSKWHLINYMKKSFSESDIFS